jgi:uncharacterized protein with von Willebrand factor type A (vWA) domain
MFQNKIQSHKLSMFGSFRYSTRKGGEQMVEAREKLAEELDMIIETDEDIAKYGTNTEFDAEDFQCELFGRIHGGAEQVEDNEWNAAHEALDSLDEVRMLMKSCRNDADLSSLATSYIIDTMSEEIANVVKEYRDYIAENPDNEDEDGDTPGFSPSPDVQADFKSKSKDLKEMIKELEELKDQMSVAGKPEGMFDPPDSEDDRMSLVREFRNKGSTLNQVLKIVGRLNDSIKGLGANAHTMEMIDQEITIGQGSPDDLLSSELMLLATDETADLFADRWIRRQQFKWKKKGKAKKIGGPLTVLIDESGSMAGTYNQLAKAIATAVLIMSGEQKRDCTILGFMHYMTFGIKKTRSKMLLNYNNYGRNNLHNDRWSPISYSRALNMLCNRGTGGGTSFEIAVEQALRESKGKNADILFVTDGADRIQEHALKRLLKSKKRDGTRIFTIVLGCSNDSLQSVSDALIHFRYLNDDSINSIAKLMKVMER